MELTVGRITARIRRGATTRPKNHELGKRFRRGPYGAWWALPLCGPWFSVSALRRYPNDRLRCEKCGHRKNDT